MARVARIAAYSLAMDRELLERVGTALFGDVREGDGRPAWVHPLGDALGIGRRTFERMAAGKASTPDLRAELRQLCLDRGKVLEALALELAS